jgi:F-type H+-transporting ATPase subunit b
MESTLHALGGLLLKALPTFFLVVLLHFYLKAIFFKPLGKVLKERYEATEGARKAAEASLKRAADKAAEYEAELKKARAAVYAGQESLHRKLQEDRAAAARQARAGADQAVAKAKAELEAQAAVLKAQLEAESEALAEQIAASVLRRRAA